MKQLLYSICIGSLALAVTAWGEQVKDTATVPAKAKTRGAAVQSTTTNRTAVRSTGAMRSQSHISTAPFRQRTYSVAPRTSSTTAANKNARVRTSRERNVSANAKVRTRSNVAVNRNRTVNRDRSLAVNRERNMTASRGRNLAVNRGRNMTSNNRLSFADATRLHRGEFHSRDWWRSHFDTIVFVSGGWWFWDGGWWFPAYGYAPGAYYPYGGPIYGYNGLTPDRVVVDVQLQLRRDGYYAGPVDGALGPMTRRAITAFQADHGLAVTSTIDEPTLETLGLS